MHALEPDSEEAARLPEHNEDPHQDLDGVAHDAGAAEPGGEDLQEGKSHRSSQAEKNALNRAAIAAQVGLASSHWPFCL